MALPKIVKVGELPQWIISSDKAAYHPHSNTIYLTKWRYFPHEILHYFGHTFNWDWIHNFIDGKTRISVIDGLKRFRRNLLACIRGYNAD